MRTYLFRCKIKTSFRTRCESSRQGKCQRQARCCWQDEFVVHEDVMDKDFIFGAGHEFGHNLVNITDALTSPSLWSVVASMHHVQWELEVKNYTLEGMTRIKMSAYMAALSAMDFSSLPLM